jgi:ABC-2 type transport system permease protein
MSGTLLTPDSRPRAQVRPTGTSFVGLVGVELRRLWWRRLAKVVLVGVVAFVGVSAYASYQQTRPEALAERIDDYASIVAETTRQNAAVPAEEKAAQIEACRRDEAANGGGSEGVDFRCDQLFQPPSPADFGIVTAERTQITSSIVDSGVWIFGFLAFILGASFVSAEFAAGSMGNWLTFEPRRLRVGASKLIAAAIGGLTIGALGVTLAALGATLVTTVNRPGSELQIPGATVVPGDSAGQGLLRVVAIVALGGLGGAVIGLLLRSTAGVIGLVVGWLVVVEAFLANAFAEGRLQPWFLRTNIEGFVKDGTTYFANQCGADGCQSLRVPHSYTASWVYLLAVAVLGVVAALMSFRSRDVT